MNDIEWVVGEKYITVYGELLQLVADYRDNKNVNDNCNLTFVFLDCPPKRELKGQLVCCSSENKLGTPLLKKHNSKESEKHIEPPAKLPNEKADLQELLKRLERANKKAKIDELIDDLSTISFKHGKMYKHYFNKTSSEEFFLKIMDVKAKILDLIEE